MKTADFDFHLPDELIAQAPLARRDASRLLHLPRAGGASRHLSVTDLPTLLQPGDLLVLNDAKVLPARLLGEKAKTGGKVELLLVDPLPPFGSRAQWRCMAQSSKGLHPGQELLIAGKAAQVVEVEGDGFARVVFEVDEAELEPWLEQVGELPLPPYLRREPTALDSTRYQTIFARSAGAVAAPTAGLHFTEDLFDGLRRAGVRIETLTLIVGPGTFLPVRADRIDDHRMHGERYEIPVATARAVAETKAARRRVIAVGTTALRALETATEGGETRPGPGVSHLFVRPGYEPRVVDGLLTNFHLPRSTLVMLVAALAGKERLLAAYAEAIEARYRFYSYGDAMLLL